MKRLILGVLVFGMLFTGCDEKSETKDINTQSNELSKSDFIKAKNIYETFNKGCHGCHGYHGERQALGISKKIAGQSPKVTIKKLRDYQKTRNIFWKHLLTEEEIKLLAKYIFTMK